MTQEIGIYRREDLLMEKGSRSEHKKTVPQSLSGLSSILKKNYKELLFLTIAAFLLYSVMIVNELTNTYDGMWRGDYGYVGAWELSIGRWFWLYLDKFRLGLGAEPALSLLSLASLTFADVIAADLLQIKKGFFRYIFEGLMLANTAVSIYLSYRFMVPTFTFSFLFSILSAWFLQSVFKEREHKALNIFLSILFLMLSLGLYQANLGCLFVILSLLVIQSVWHQKEILFKQRVKHLFGGLLLIGISCIFYAAVWDVHLKLMHVEKSSYHGASGVSIFTILSGLPKTIKEAYFSFFQYFFPGQLNNIYQKYYLPALLLGILVFLAVISTVCQKKAVLDKALAVICIALLPLFANVCLLLAPESGGVQLQMTMPMAMVIPGLMGILFSCNSAERRCFRGAKTFVTCAIIGLLFGNVMMVSVDQHEMLQTKNTSIALMNRIMTNMEGTVSSLNPETQYVFAGVPTENSLYKKDVLWDRSNSYAHYGEFWTGGNCVTQSYAGYLRDCGFNVPLLGDDVKYHEILDSEEVQNMPAYPSEGYAKMVDGYLVIKIS